MKKNKKLIIIGAGEFSKIAYEYFTYDSLYEVCGFCVEKKFIAEKELNGLPITALEDIQSQYSSDDYNVFIAIPASDMNQTRTRLYELLKSKGYNFASYISSATFVWRNAKIGDNCFIFENNTIQPFVEIGNNVILWSGNHIGHSTFINDNVFVSSHVVISGYCEIGKGCFLGVNSTFNDKTSIAENSLLGSGSLVNKSLLDSNTVYRGSPAKAIPGIKALSIKL